MKTVSCKDMGVTCDFVAKAETADAAVAMLSEHAMASHKEAVDEMAKTMTPDQMKEAMMAKVKDEA